MRLQRKERRAVGGSEEEDVEGASGWKKGHQGD
jgi:hypothetical protein